MKILLVTLRKRAGSDDVSRRETFLEGDAIRVGRGVAMEVNLPDIDVDFHHATLVDQGGLTLRAVGENGLTVGKRAEREVALRPGVEVRISRFTFRAEGGRDGADYALIMEEAPEAPGPRHAALGKGRRLEDVLPSRRLLSWVFSLAVLGLFIAWPMSEVLTRPDPADGPVVVDGMARSDIPAPSVMEAAWSSGPLSSSHSMIENDCAACHQRPFEMTTNDACLACHAETTNHAHPGTHPVVALDNARCASCHKEHNGGETPTEIANTACAACHSDIKTASAKSRLSNITAFAADHPAFQLALIVDVTEDANGGLTPVVQRTVIQEGTAPKEASGLRFPHAKHLSKGGVETGNGKRHMVCADCHQPLDGGRLMRPMEMERDCSGCHAHKLEFDAAGVKRLIPHAPAGEVERVLRDYYMAAALAGNVVVETVPEDEAPAAPAPAETAPAATTTEDAPKPDTRKRKRHRARVIAGQTDTRAKAQTLSADNRQAAIEWAADEARLRIDTLFKKQLCGTCHEVQQLSTEGLAERWRVRPALVQHHWMPKARFDHTPHDAMDCTSCHAATTSSEASDVLMPAIKTCRGCHDDATGADAAGAACVDCHEYHVPGRTPMSPAHAEIAASRRFGRQQSEPGE